MFVGSLATHNVISIDASCSVPCVYEEPRCARNLLIVIVAMVGYDQDTIVLFEILQWSGPHLKVVFSTFANEGQIWVVVGYRCALRLQELNDRESRRLAEVVNVFLVCDSEHKDIGPI